MASSLVISPALIKSRSVRPRTYSITMKGSSDCRAGNLLLLFAGVEDRNDIGMVQPGHGLGLAPKACLHHGIARHFGAQQLDGHLAPQDLVDAQVHVGHAAASNELTHDVAAVENSFLGHCENTIII